MAHASVATTTPHATSEKPIATVPPTALPSAGMDVSPLRGNNVNLRIRRPATQAAKLFHARVCRMVRFVPEALALLPATVKWIFAANAAQARLIRSTIRDAEAHLQLFAGLPAFAAMEM